MEQTPPAQGYIDVSIVSGAVAADAARTCRQALLDPVNLAEHRIRRKQILGGLTNEYHVAA